MLYSLFINTKSDGEKSSIDKNTGKPLKNKQLPLKPDFLVCTIKKGFIGRSPTSTKSRYFAFDSFTVSIVFDVKNRK
jgi:hypothetical protein